MNSRPPVSAKLWSLLATLLPDSRETLFLRACLDDAAPEAWDRWQRTVADEGASARRALAPFNVFLPLLRWNLTRTGATLDGPLLTFLRSAHLTEELRWQRYRAICASALDVLTRHDVACIVLKGAALAESVYPAPALRHADDVDVLVPRADGPRAAARLVAEGWRPTPATIPPSLHHWPPLLHPSGLPLELHFRLAGPYYTLPYEALWARRERATVAGCEVSVLSPADGLLHVCAHAMLGVRVLRWVPDAWFIVARHRNLSWSTLVSAAVTARLALPLYATLSYLAESMRVPVPRDALEALGEAAARTGVRGRSAARLAACPWPRDTARQAWARPDPVWRRLALLRRRLVPSPVEFALLYDLRWWQLPLAYVKRLLRYARRATGA